MASSPPMWDCMKKLTIWETETFKPIFTHEDLEPIMEKLGFFPGTSQAEDDGNIWKEYKFYADVVALLPRVNPLYKETKKHQPPPPYLRLPYPRLDGCHLFTYRAFMEAIRFYTLSTPFIGARANYIFQVRGIPLDIQDRSHRWIGMRNYFFYVEGRLDKVANDWYRAFYIKCNGNDGENDDAPSLLVPLENIILQSGNNGNGRNYESPGTESSTT